MQYLQPTRTRFARRLDWFSRLSAIMGRGAFSCLSDQALTDHHWASESALQAGLAQRKCRAGQDPYAPDRCHGARNAPTDDHSLTSSLTARCRFFNLRLEKGTAQSFS